MTSLLEIKNLTTQFRTPEQTVTAVEDASFRILPGETVAVVGESGSGKTVTALSILRLVPPPGIVTRGEITFSKNNVTVPLSTLSEKEMQSYRGNNIGMIFQEPMTSLNPVFRCGDQVSEAIRAHKSISAGEAKEKTMELFRKVKLDEPERIYRSYPHQLSGGQKQRVMIAMAICCEPALLIADEPTTSVDTTVQAAILDLLASLQKETGMSILFITHDLAVVAKLAHRVVVMYKGKIVEQGTVKEIFDAPQHPYTRGLLACRPPLDIRCHTLPVLSDFMRTSPAGEPEETGQEATALFEKYKVTTDERSQRLAGIYRREPLLRLRNLVVSFPVSNSLFSSGSNFIHAVNDVSLDIYPGETLGLAGESGSGKTTLGKSIVRLTEPSSGEIIFKGTDILKMEKTALRQLRKDVQIIFQDPYASLNPRMTAGEAILEPIRVHGLARNDNDGKSKAMEWLRRVGLKEEHYDRYPHEFSGGQRQRICIARAIALQPSLLLCDESVSALDVSIQAMILNLLNDLKKEEGFTILFISHDLSVVRHMSDRIAVMKSGRLEETGDAEEIFHSPKSVYTKNLVDAIPQAIPVLQA